MEGKGVAGRFTQDIWRMGWVRSDDERPCQSSLSSLFDVVCKWCSLIRLVMCELGGRVGGLLGVRASVVERS